MEQMIPWQEIEQALDTLVPATSGYSQATRGIVTIADGREVFVKIGTDERTRAWTHKEVLVYDFLATNDFSHIPALLATNSSRTGLALEVLSPTTGWNWQDSWGADRVDATLAAMDMLAALQPDPQFSELLKPVLTDEDNGWAKLEQSRQQQFALKDAFGPQLPEGLLENLADHSRRSATYQVQHDSLVHDDVRADNCAWHSGLQRVALIDWNWAEVGDRQIDLASFLTHVQATGFDVLTDYAHRLNPSALHWMAGFWLEAASRPMWPGGPASLRPKQFSSALTALALARNLT